MFKIKNPVVPIFLLLTVSVYVFLMVASCKNGGTDSGKKPVTIVFPKDNSGLDSIDHYISSELIDKYEAAFKEQKDTLSRLYPSLLLPKSEAFNKRSLLSLLQLQDCVGLRIYHGVKTGKQNQLRIIIVGVDSKGNDIMLEQGSIIAAKLTQSKGGLEMGQCSDCTQR